MSDSHKLFEAELSRSYAERRKVLRSLARRKGGQDDEDIVQDAFLKVVERSRRREISTVDKFLTHIVGLLAIDRSRRRAFRLSRAEAEEGAVDAVADPERTLMGAQRLSRVLEVIEDMPPKRREVFLLHRIEELTYPQIAKRLEISVKTVEKHMHLAMLQLSDADD